MCKKVVFASKRVDFPLQNVKENLPILRQSHFFTHLKSTPAERVAMGGGKIFLQKFKNDEFYASADHNIW